MKNQWETDCRETGKTLAAARRQNTRWAVLRFILFLIAAAALFQLIDGNLYFGLMMIPALLGFLMLMQIQARCQNQIQHLEAREQVLNDLLSRFDTQWQKRKDTGADFINENEPWMQDLDVLGERSLYQFCSMAKLAQGRKKLADYFNGEADIKTLQARQEAVRELSEKPDFLIADWTEGQLLSSSGAAAMSETSLKTLLNPIPLSFPAWFIRALPWVTLTLLALTLLKWIPPLCFILIFFAQAAMSLFSLAAVRSGLQAVYKSRRGLQNTLNRAQLIDHNTFSSSQLTAMQHCLRGHDGFFNSVRQVDRLLSGLSLQANPFLYLPAQLFLLWDLRCALSWNRWILLGGQRWLEITEMLGELEALSSLAVVALVRPKICYPEFQSAESNPQLTFTNITHPLLPPENAVGNDFSLDHSLTLITGSNMSGKTTFMRTVGLNQVLAQAGGCVSAQAMTTGNFRIVTSMRIHDDVSEGISTFYGELLRIRTILDAAAKARPLLVLIDEIFKGTNSLDRIDGSREVLKQLNHPWIRALVTTHDFELCAMEQDRSLSLVNMHFQEHYQNNQILFDYRLKPGRCTQRNARYLMKMIGITD